MQARGYAACVCEQVGRRDGELSPERCRALRLASGYIFSKVNPIVFVHK